ncbi:PREDICTED: tetratricopeptide [Prunus dulcis]|uniref:PREDICTED: tetratricopeptide n=1 Tax=Prunus dulcis TaxID=3755 RepID=A0A5E4EJS6_PRUDU|nr:PREDICTED: tetratricopeptide [Prunus dulcis]
MEKGSEPQTESERDDLDAIAALKENTAIELKDKGNEYVKMGKKHFADAIDWAHVNLLLGNYRRALTDAEDSIKLCSTNVKALYRAAKAYFALNLLLESTLHCQNGLKHDPSNEELKKLLRQIESKKMEHEQREAQAHVYFFVETMHDLVSAIESRGLKIGKAMYQGLTGLRKPVLDKNNILHWPVLLLYAEVMSSDFIEDFSSNAFGYMCILCFPEFSNMFSENCPPLSWDQEHNYTREAVELYYEASPGVSLSKTKILRCLLEGTAASHVENIGDEEKDANKNSNDGSSAGKGSSKWVKVNEKRALHDVLKEPNFVIRGIPASIKSSKLGNGLLHLELLVGYLLKMGDVYYDTSQS